MPVAGLLSASLTNHLHIKYPVSIPQKKKQSFRFEGTARAWCSSIGPGTGHTVTHCVNRTPRARAAANLMSQAVLRRNSLSVINRKCPGVADQLPTLWISTFFHPEPGAVRMLLPWTIDARRMRVQQNHQGSTQGRNGIASVQALLGSRIMQEACLNEARAASVNSGHGWKLQADHALRWHGYEDLQTTSY